MNKDILKIPLIAATEAVGRKHLVSRLQPSNLAPNKTGNINDAQLYSENNTDNPYPLVSGKDLYGKDFLVPIIIKGQTDTIYLPEAIVSISKGKDIVATPVLNGKGTVKEMITDGDLKLSINVAIVSTMDDGSYDEGSMRYNDVYPYLGVQRLRKLLDEPNRLDIVSEFLKQFDLDGGSLGIIVQSYTVNQETYSNRQEFSIEAFSDYDYNLLIEE